MTAPSTEPREVVIEFEVDEADAERTYNAMAKLVHELGEIGTLSMRQRGDIDDLLRDAARYRWLIRHPGRLIDDLYDADEAATKENVGAMIDAEIAREEGR
ncbi:MAG TPA: hypothetical protein VGR45_19105 [Stellaceae bacterium]|nr:hypothetical protein [Stellaceae bacterium]